MTPVEAIPAGAISAAAVLAGVETSAVVAAAILAEVETSAVVAAAISVEEAGAISKWLIARSARNWLRSRSFPTMKQSGSLRYRDDPQLLKPVWLALEGAERQQLSTGGISR